MTSPDSATPLPERNLDLLRSTAVLCVVACHLMTAAGMSAGYGRYVSSTLGDFGVYVFFVHTALVLMGSLEREGNRSGWVRSFYVRRAFRIYPLAIVAILLVVATGEPASGHAAPLAIPASAFPRFTTRAVLSDIALVQNLTAKPSLLGPIWTLPVELQMYLLLPVCFLAARRGAAAVGTLFVAFAIAYLVVAHPAAPMLARLTVFAYGPCFLAGVVAYFLMRQKSVRIQLPVWTLAAVVVIAAVYLSVVLPSRHLPLIWLAPLAIGFVLPFVRNAAPSRITRAAHTLCTYSYGVYLFHVPVIWLSVIRLHAFPWPIRIATLVAGITVLPWLGYRVLERPMIDLGKRIARGRVPVRDDAIALAPAP